MQFVKHGPDIPETLLQAHEESRVVFFCGAGVSYPAGLPGFKGLVDQIYDTLGTTRTDIEDQAYSKNQFDGTLDLLERRYPGQRLAVRTALAKVLKPNLRRKGAKDTHIALLQLARCKDGATRLVTTNFDRVFEGLMSRAKPPIQGYAAPMLPIPKSSRWNGVVYLHGLLPEKIDESHLQRLVLTSGDFGLAYLTERWAARFVSDLFRNYVVCFVGYSINDPVLRYMMDALAADRMQGEATLEAYAIGDYAPGEEAVKKTEWEAKGVTPILYEVQTVHDHSALHRTLKAWAETHRDGVQGQERIVLDYAGIPPLESTKQDDYVGRLMWALSHDSGLPAKRFAEFAPAPSLEWLKPFSEERYGHSDLSRFGVPSKLKRDDKLAFSLLRRPSPYTHAPWMTLGASGSSVSEWDHVMFQLARWLTRHLNDPALVIWLAGRGGTQHERLALFIENRLDELAKFELEGKTAELDRIRASSPNGIPHPLMRVVWRLFFSGRGRSNSENVDLYTWMARLKQEGLTPALRLKLRDLLTPKILFRQPYHLSETYAAPAVPGRIKDLVNWDLVLAADYVYACFADLTGSEPLQVALPLLLGDFQRLLSDTLDLFRELGEADDYHDQGYWDLPSISEHWQNRRFRDWTALIELVREAWLATLRRDMSRARRIASDWFEVPYSTFKRLALFAAQHEDVVSEDQWVDWLLADEGWWLWSVETLRETMRLLVLKGERLTQKGRSRLEAGILAGPPPRMFRGDIEPDRWQSLSEGMVWLRLAKLTFGGAKLEEESSKRLAELSASHPDWKVAQNQSDEFGHWMSGTGDPDFEDQKEFHHAPRNRHALVTWLQLPPSKHYLYEDDWRELSRQRLTTVIWALCKLASESKWPVGRWREALQAWSEEKLIVRSWRYAAPLLDSMPEDVLLEVAHGATWWLEAASKILSRHDAIFFRLCRRFLAMTHQDSFAGDHTLTRALNHPVGHVTQALLHHWFATKPNDDQGLPVETKAIFTSICDSPDEQSRLARLLIAANSIALFRVDRSWSSSHLLPRFNWQASRDEALTMWQGFLWAPRLYQPLLIALKSDFLQTAHHYSDLGEHARQYAALLTYVALDPADMFQLNELRDATNALPQEGLRECAQALVHALEGAGTKRNEQWQNRIEPYWKEIWPKSRNLASKSLAALLTRLVLAADEKFPEALTTVADWLQPLEHSQYEVHLLKQSGLCGRFPEQSLGLLNLIVEEQSWPPMELGACLRDISAAWPDAEMDARYRRLVDYARRHEQV